MNPFSFVFFFEEDTPVYNNVGDVTKMEIDFESEEARKRMQKRAARFGSVKNTTVRAIFCFFLRQ